MPSGGSWGKSRAWRISSGTPAAYSEISVRETYEADRDGTRRLDLGLERPQAPQVGAEHHQAQVGLVAEEGGRHDLVAVRLGRLDRLAEGLGVEAVRLADRNVAEEVEHGLAHRRDERGAGVIRAV